MNIRYEFLTYPAKSEVTNTTLMIFLKVFLMVYHICTTDSVLQVRYFEVFYNQKISREK